MEKPITEKKKMIEKFYKISTPIVAFIAFIMTVKTDNDIWMMAMFAYITGVATIVSVMDFIETRKESGKLKIASGLFTITFVASAFVYCIVNMLFRS
ncbi:hypothetical protein [Mechercharimyces sp. CAU 1602]|uniref:hypothetical protein n=1 Tax=Mechercharimyces sp. CAU 1602 TaxID=2973933 RepID=UPI00216177A6|nr:hypothetical protein [Mechercharimyces sp. CAU 1602]MCS1350306.1 hypothetical protein [Mechercharimyces sp. CAU 1602]